MRAAAKLPQCTKPHLIMRSVRLSSTIYVFIIRPKIVREVRHETFCSWWKTIVGFYIVRLDSLHKESAFLFFFLNDPAPPEIYPLPLHDPLPICQMGAGIVRARVQCSRAAAQAYAARYGPVEP